MSNDKITGSMSEELTDTNWPNPEQSGYYWLKCRTEAQSELEIFYWNKGTEVFSDIGDVGCVDEGCFADHWEYHGPVKTPTQISEMLAGERERCAKAAQKVSDEYYEKRDAADNDDDRVYCDERMCAASECVDDIRNLGAAP